jgi:hypothetical protein
VPVHTSDGSVTAHRQTASRSCVTAGVGNSSKAVGATDQPNTCQMTYIRLMDKIKLHAHR